MKPLSKSYKSGFPFKLATTSFIYPDNILPNVRMLSPFVDEIELILFESRRESLPTPQDILELARIGEAENLTYNVHLPLDISIADPDSGKGETAIRAMHQVMDLTNSLNPSTWTLHLTCDEVANGQESLEKWQGRAKERLEKFLSPGYPEARISIENLSQPFEWTAPLIYDLGLSICMDVGHLMTNGFDAEAFYRQYQERITIIHLSGVENGKDHLGLDRMEPSRLESLMDILKGFTGVLCLEIFSYDDLTASLDVLEKMWHNSGNSG